MLNGQYPTSFWWRTKHCALLPGYIPYYIIEEFPYDCLRLYFHALLQATLDWGFLLAWTPRANRIHWQFSHSATFVNHSIHVVSPVYSCAQRHATVFPPPYSLSGLSLQPILELYFPLLSSLSFFKSLFCSPFVHNPLDSQILGSRSTIELDIRKFVAASTCGLTQRRASIHDHRTDCLRRCQKTTYIFQGFFTRLFVWLVLDPL